MLRAGLWMFFSWNMAQQLGLVTALGPARLLGINEDWLGLIIVCICVALWKTRLRYVCLLASTFIGLLYLVVAYTPAFVSPMRQWLLRDAPAKADALVVLSAGSASGDYIDTGGLERLIAGVQYVSDGEPPNLIVTGVPRTEWADVRADQHALSQLGMGAEQKFTVHRVEPVRSTYDEAVLTKQLAREKGWRRIVVVTSAMHMRRAAATFRKQGLQVIAMPCPERKYSIPQLSSPIDRIQGFRDWVSELTAYTLYYSRGHV